MRAQRSAGALRNVGLCGRNLDGLQLMRISLGRPPELRETMPPHSPIRSFALTHHIQEGGTWLSASASGSHSTMVGYAGFELRLGIERLMLEYLIQVDGDQLKSDHLKLVSSIKSVQNRIYQLEGHQGKIDRKFRVFQILFEMMEMPFQMVRPNLGQLAKYWHLCSEFCHIGWTLGSASGSVSVLEDGFRSLSDVHTYLDEHTQQLVTWPRFVDPKAKEMQQQFIDGIIGEEEVRAYFRRVGVWSRYEGSDGTMQFVGKAITPESV